MKFLTYTLSIRNSNRKFNKAVTVSEVKHFACLRRVHGSNNEWCLKFFLKLKFSQYFRGGGVEPISD
jgi:hypothetical protein